VSDFYAPGCEVCIFSDGRVFADLVGVKDSDMEHYWDTLKQMVPSKFLVFDDLDTHIQKILSSSSSSSPSLSSLNSESETKEPCSAEKDAIKAAKAADTVEQTNNANFSSSSSKPTTYSGSQIAKYLTVNWETEEDMKKLDDDIKNDEETALLYRGFIRFLEQVFFVFVFVFCSKLSVLCVFFSISLFFLFRLFELVRSKLYLIMAWHFFFRMLSVRANVF
jgi:pyoverdine/dityrosine biosynthesis protein Dit1